MPKSVQYDAEKAGIYWSRRVKEVDPLSAVLTYNAPKEINKAYDLWERKALITQLPSSQNRKKARSALDLGCGIGRLSLLLLQQGYNVTAVDVSQEMLSRCIRRASRAKLRESLECLSASANTVNLSNRKFDIITCFGLLEHLPPRVRSATMKHAFAHLASKGRMFVVVNNSACIWLNKRYHLTRQTKDGYYVGLVGVSWLQRLCSKHNMKLNIVASNPLYSIAHYCLSDNAQVDTKTLKRFVRVSSDVDLQLSPESPFAELTSAHYMMEIRHNR